MTSFVFLVSVGLFAEMASSKDVSTVVEFDRTTVRRGDMAFATVRLVNHSDEPCDVAPLVAGYTVWFTVELVGETMDLAANDAVRWQTGGGAFIGYKPRSLPAGATMVTWIPVPLLTAESLRQVSGKPSFSTVTAVVYCENPRVGGAKPTRITIEGDICKTPSQLDLVPMLYVPYKRHPKMSDEWWDRMRHLPQLRHVDGLSESPWTLSVPSRLEWLRRQLVEESAMYRCASITRALQACVLARDDDKRRAVAQIATELAPCGEGEREWYIRCHIPLRLTESLDVASRRIFKETFPSCDKPFELIPPAQPVDTPRDPAHVERDVDGN